MERRTSEAMRHIRRAAVTGLFAIWLAPLSAAAEAPAGAGLRAERTTQVERAAIETSREQEDDHDRPDSQARREG